MASLAALGVAAMWLAALLAPRLGLAFSLRSQLALGELLLALPVLVFLLARPSDRRAAFGRGSIPVRTAGLSVVLGAALWVGSLGLMEMQSLAFPPSEETLELFRRIHAALAPSGPLDVLVSLVIIAVLPAVCEELVLRGALLPSLALRLGGLPAVVVTAVVFALIHGDLVRLLFTFALGLLLGLLRLGTRSLWPPVIVHVTLNSLTFAIAPLVDDPSRPYTPQPALGLACLVAGAALSVPLLRALRREPAPPA